MTAPPPGRLSAAQRALVAANVPLIDAVCRRVQYRGYIAFLGWEEAWSLAAHAVCRAARTYTRDRGPFWAYAAFWVKKFFLEACRAEVLFPRPMGVGPDDAFLALAGRDRPPLDVASDKELVRVVMAALPPRNRRVLRLRAAGHSWTEIGAKLSVSRARAAQIHDASKERVFRLAPQVLGR